MSTPAASATSGSAGERAVSLEPLTPDRRRAMTREHLLRAAAVVFARNGFYGASLDEVAAAAGFTKGAVYSNFKSKEDLFVALLEDHLDQQRVAVEHALDEVAEEDDQMPRMSSLLRELMWDEEWTALYVEFVLYAARNEQARALLAESARREQTVVESMIQREYDRVGAEAPFPLSTLARISIAMFNGLGMQRLYDPMIFAEGFESVIEFLFATIGVDTEPEAGDGGVTPQE
jgi:AcrR family transcriptional regulator